MSIQPLGDRIVVERHEAETTTAAGIVLPGNQEAPSTGKVLYVGKGQRQKDGSYLPMDVQVGDTVVFGKYAGTEVEVNGEKLLVMKQDDVVGILTTQTATV